MRILNIADSAGDSIDQDTGRPIHWDNWIINCIDPNPADGRKVKKPNGSGVYVCGNAMIQYKIKKEDLKRFYTGDIKSLQSKDFTAFFDQNGQLIAVNIK